VSIHRINPFDAEGRIRNWDADWCVYTAFAEPGDGTVLVKVGLSGGIYDRALSLCTACPYRIDPILWARTGSQSAARLIERRMHAEFRARRTSGEWFRFDMRSPADKAEFKAVALGAFAAHSRTGVPEWKTITKDQLREYGSMKRNKKYLIKAP